MEDNKKKSEDEKIIYIIENVLNAKSETTAVSLEEIIDTGIELQMTIDRPRGGHDGHPWSPRISILSGVSNNEITLKNQEVKYLHRKKIKGQGRGARITWRYWIDKTKKHVVKRTKWHKGDQQQEDQENAYQTALNEGRISPIPAGKELTPQEKFEMYEQQSPGKFQLVGDKILLTSWIQNNPEKFKAIYGGVSK